MKTRVKTKSKYNDPIAEAQRYLNNAKEVLRKKTKIIDGLYSDSKYVKMASNTVYNGILIALDAYAKKRGKKPKNRPDKSFYQDLLATENRKMLNKYNNIYNLLHLSGGYDGTTNVLVFKEGYRLATELIKWVEMKLK